MFQSALRVPVLLVAMLVPALAASAFSLDPTVTEIELPSEGGGQTIFLENPREVDIPVVFEIYEREISESGEEHRTAADESFLIFPPQATVGAGQRQAVRIQWVGDPFDQSRSFTLYARELPVELSGEQSGLRTLMRMGASVHVTQNSFSASPRLKSSTPVDGGVSVSLYNDGNEYIYIDDLSLQFGDQKVEGVSLAIAAGRTLLLPGATRTFMVPDVAGIPSVSIAGD